jgi:hypothetical protein
MAELFIITNSVPVPPLHGRPGKYPFAQMKKGNSFWAKTKKNNLLIQAKLFSKKQNPEWKFIAQKEKDGTRIWRVE